MAFGALQLLQLYNSTEITCASYTRSFLLREICRPWSQSLLYELNAALARMILSFMSAEEHSNEPRLLQIKENNIYISEKITVLHLQPVFESYLDPKYH